MLISEIKGTQVLDKSAKLVGKVEDADFNVETGKIESFVVILQKNIISKATKISIKFDEIQTIGEFILLNDSIDVKEDTKSESKKVDVDDK